MDDNQNSQTTDQQVVDVTPVESPEELIPDAVKTQLSVESLIKSYISRIAKTKEDLKPVREMLSDLLENNEEYHSAAEEAKEASKKKSAVKSKILSTPEGKMANDKLIGLRDELSEAQEALSTYLTEYAKMTGSTQFEGEDGELRQIVYVAKLVRKTNLED